MSTSAADARATRPLTAPVAGFVTSENRPEVPAHALPSTQCTISGIAIVASSERTGHMERGLREHAAYLAWVERLRDKLVSASIYPATLLVAGGAVG